MPLILTTDPTAVAGANLLTMVRDLDQTMYAALIPYAAAVSASQLVGTELQLTVHDPTKQGMSNTLRTSQGMATALSGAIASRVGFRFNSVKFVDG